jgi:protease II
VCKRLPDWGQGLFARWERALHAASTRHALPALRLNPKKQKQFYTVKDHLDRPYKVLRHNIHAAPAGGDAADEVVYEEKDEVRER